MHIFEQSVSELAPSIRAEVEYVAPLSIGAHGTAVRRVQEWLNLHGNQVVVDGGFGAATARGVVAFQSDNGIEATGVVDEETFDSLVAPMVGVLRRRVNPGPPLSEALLEYATAHLLAHPLEVGGPNSGPWVRLYMSGRQGASLLWCAGFVSFLLDQAAESLGAAKPIAGSASCDTLAAQASQAGILLSDQETEKVSSGSLFLVRQSVGDWTHVGIVTDTYDDAFDTVEGNTNDAGVSEGYEVCARTRAWPGKDYISL